jgi:FMN phosphatase YigB (HAD superfamily)
MIKAIVFDCFGVLTVDIWRAFCDGLPASVDRQSLRDLNRAADSGMINFTDFAAGVMELTGEVLPDVTQMSGSGVVKNEALLTRIASLRSMYKIGLLSNISNDWITNQFLTPKEQALFDDIVASFEVRLTKPDPRIFALACERLGVTTQEAIMVDDVERYVTAARETGMHGIVYDELKNFEQELTTLLDANT